MTLRVLHIGKFFPPDPGGMEVYLADLMHAQRGHGLDAHALVHGTPRPDDPAWLVRVPVAARLMHVVPLAPGFRRALAQAIERIEPDVLHLHMPNASALLALTLASARRIPWVVHWHSDVVSSTIRGRIALAYKVYRPFEQALLEQAERIVVTSQDYLAASAPLQRWRNKCTVVPLGLDPARLPEAPAAPVESLWEDGAFRLLSVGRLTYYKGFETLMCGRQGSGLGAGRGKLLRLCNMWSAGGLLAGRFLRYARKLSGNMEKPCKSNVLSSCRV